MKLSVVIPCRNAGSLIKDQLEGLCNQDWDGEWEVVVANNGSSDDSMAEVDAFRDRLNLEVVDASMRIGRVWAANAGARVANGTCLLFVDADDQVDPGYVRAMAEALSDHAFVAGRLDCEALNPQWLRGSRGAPQTSGLQRWHDYLPWAMGCSLGVRKDVFESVQGFDISMDGVEDIDFCWRVQLAGVPLVFAPDAVLRYRYRDRLGHIYRQATRYGRGPVRLYERYRPVGLSRWARFTTLALHVPPLIVRVVTLSSRSRRARWVWDAGYLAGLLLG